MMCIRDQRRIAYYGTTLLLAVTLLDVGVSAFASCPRWYPRTPASSSARGVAASILDNTGDAEYSPGKSSGKMILNELINELDFQEADRADEETERLLSRRREQLRNRFTAATSAGTYRIQLPLVQDLSDALFGMTIVEVGPGYLASKRELNLDTMRITVVKEEEKMQVPATLEPTFRGLIVKAVIPDSPADRAGVIAGDVLSAVSATLGGSVWPTSTLQGVQSALSSRKLTSGSVALELRRLESEVLEAEVAAGEIGAETAAPSDGRFELTLTRPLGFQIGEDDNGYVVVTGVSDTASTLVQYGVAVGDCVVAVDSSLGGQLWPVSTVEGVISAVTSRLPGQAVTVQFKRPQANLEIKNSQFAKSVVSSDVAATKENGKVLVAPVASNQKELVKRCRDVLKRYSDKDTANRNLAVQKMSALVADKVVDALASASSTIDSVTLSMIMNAYLSCSKAKSAIRIFEAATGFSGDGSSNPTKVVISGKERGQIVPTESALNLYTGSALLQAHAATGDYDSVSRVMAALEGRSGVVDEDGILESAPWPMTGADGSIQPDTVCYNIAIAAADKVGGRRALLRALELFDRMSDSKTKKSGPRKNEVTYNSLISALCNAGRPKEAFGLFEQMRSAGLRPDKFTYTSLIKACVQENDIQELLYDMIERGVQPDVVTYNTMIKLLCEKRQLTQATKLVTEMELRGILPDSLTYGVLMNGLLQAGKPSACLSLFESACSNSRTAALTENVHLYTTAITAASVLGDHERALELVSRMTATGVKTNLKTLTAVMGACLSSGKPEFAVQLFDKIEKPDGYAMHQGMLALCESGELSRAAEMIESQRRGSRVLSGKQMMMSYKNILHSSLLQKDHQIARRMFSDLLEKGYIPSKPILLSIIEALELNRRGSSQVELTDDDASRFGFLLFVIDSLQKRNLPVEGLLYVATLTMGGQLGGLPRKVASLLARAKSTADAVSKELMSSQDAILVEEKIVKGWEELIDDYDSLAKDLSVEQLPLLPVRVAPRDMVRTLRAEQSVTYINRRKSLLKSTTEANAKR